MAENKNQVIVASEWFTTLVIVAIVAAGVNVGVSTYPSVARSTGVIALDYLVQCIFTFDVIFKVLMEGKRPWLYWLVMLVKLMLLSRHGTSHTSPTRHC